VEIVDYRWEMRRIAMAKTTKLLPPVHPGEILLEDFMKPLRLTVNKLAIDLQLTRRSGVVSDIERQVHPAAELVS
jgi:hypothetical protein